MLLVHDLLLLLLDDESGRQRPITALLSASMRRAVQLAQSVAVSAAATAAVTH